MGIATPWGMSHDHLSVVQTDLDARRPLELFVLDHVKIQAWDRILFVQCGDGWIVEEAWRRAVRAYVCGLDTSGADVALAKQLREVAGKVEFATPAESAQTGPDVTHGTRRSTVPACDAGV